MSREREALEKIKFEAEFNGNKESVKKIFDIAKQALAPQEIQQKAFTFEEVSEALKPLIVDIK